ncbi:MAG: hypothetical protein MJA82_10930 [Clostridia bacterium]|nr:hypothetical protein [Clostridia bacterium]
MIQQQIEIAIQQSEIPIYRVAEKSFMEEKTLYKIRKGKQQISPDKTVALAKALNKPELIKHHCKSCEIGKRYHMAYLNGEVRNEGHDILWKSDVEINELSQVLPSLIKLLFHKSNFSEEERLAIDKGMDEALDVKHCIEMFEDWYSKRFGLEALEERVKQHDKKCYDRNYAKKEIL